MIAGTGIQILAFKQLHAPQEPGVGTCDPRDRGSNPCLYTAACGTGTKGRYL